MMSGIVLSWNMTLMSTHEQAASYHLYAYQEGSEPPSTSLWKRVSCVCLRDYFLAWLIKPIREIKLKIYTFSTFTSWSFYGCVDFCFGFSSSQQISCMHPYIASALCAFLFYVLVILCSSNMLRDCWADEAEFGHHPSLFHSIPSCKLLLV